MKICITGAAGYVGSYLAQFLIRRNFKVQLIDNYYIPSNIREIEGVEIERIDIRDKTLDLSDVAVLFHLGAVSGIKRCEEDKELAFDVNVKGTFNLLRKFNGKIIFPSTSAVYGIATSPTITESHPRIPKNFYGQTKLDAEHLIRLFDSYVILRFSNIYGYGMFTKRTVTDNFVAKALKREDLEIHGDGKQRRDFVHINDTLCAYWCAMNSDISDSYNIGGNEAPSVKELAEMVIKNYRQVFGYSLKTKYIPIDSGTQWKDFEYSSSKAEKHLNYEPSYTIDGEIRSRLNAAKNLSSRSMRSRKPKTSI